MPSETHKCANCGKTRAGGWVLVPGGEAWFCNYCIVASELNDEEEEDAEQDNSALKKELTVKLTNVNYLISKFEAIKNSLELALDTYDTIELDTTHQSKQIAKMAMAVELQRKEAMNFLNVLDRYKSQLQNDLAQT